MPTKKHQERARELIGRRESTLNYDTLTEAIAAVLELVERETAERAISAGERAVHLPRLTDGEWCQSAVDAACETREQYSAAIRAEFGSAEKA